MTPQELKTSILWNAIQGKLTQQVGCESAEDILNGLSLSPIAEEECYFDIPSNWKWCKIKDVFTLVNGKAFKPTDWGQTGLPIVRIQNLNDPSAPFNYFSGEIEEKYILNGGELLFSWSGTPGTSFGAFIWHGGKAVLNQHIFIVYPSFLMDTKYAMYALNGELKVFIEKAHGGAGLKHITKKEFENCGLPIPPLAEQKRIVAKLEEILPLIDRYEAAWNKLEEFNKRFPGNMQKSILQLAIQGKLVEQRPEEGTGQAIFTQLTPYHKGLKPGKSELNLSAMEFDIPESWTMVELNQLFDFVDYRGKTPNKISDGVFLITASNIRQGFMEYTRKEYISREEYKSRQGRGITEKGDLLFTTEAPMGNAALCDLDECSCGQRIITFKEYTKRTVVPALYMYFILSPAFQQQLLDNCTGTTAKGIKADKLKHFLLPLPPYEEQKRIVAKLEEILPLCDRLK